MQPLLKINNLKKIFEGNTVLDQICLEVFEGEFISILGKSGSGKTTLLRLIAGFEKPDDGEIILEDKVIASKDICLSPEHRGIAVVFQDHALWPHMNVFDNVAFPLKVKKTPAKDIKIAVEQVLETLEMREFAHTLPHELSGGESQRIALARALIQRPRMIIFDEPLASLDALLRFELQGMLKKLQATQKFTSIYITHDQHEAMRLSHRIAVLEKGKITQISSPKDLYHRPNTENIAKLLGQSACIPIEIQNIQDETAKIAMDSYIFEAQCPQNSSNLLCIKSENIIFSDTGIPAQISECSFMGEYYLLTLQLVNQQTLRLYKKSPTPYKAGTAIHFQIQGGWILPKSGI